MFLFSESNLDVAELNEKANISHLEAPSYVLLDQLKTCTRCLGKGAGMVHAGSGHC